MPGNMPTTVDMLGRLLGALDDSGRAGHLDSQKRKAIAQRVRNVLSASNYARFKGWGTINGEGDYRFMLWAGDGSPDTFRIRIWCEEGEIENVVYDNGMDQSISGGSIVIHEK